MKTLQEFEQDNQQIVASVEKDKGTGGWIYYSMVVAACLVTGTLTYSLVYKGMSGSPLYKEWLRIAAFVPTILLEGSAIGLMYGRQYWFRSKAQRGLAYKANWIIWILLIANSITEFVIGFDGDGNLPGILRFYTRYVLPLSIVGVGVLWKELYDRKPESQQRAEVLQANAEFQADLLDVKKKQNDIIITKFKQALNAPEVLAAQEDLFKKSAIDHAKKIAGFVDDRPDNTKLLAEGRSNYQGKDKDYEDYTDRPKA